MNLSPSTFTFLIIFACVMIALFTIVAYLRLISGKIAYHGLKMIAEEGELSLAMFREKMAAELPRFPRAVFSRCKSTIHRQLIRNSLAEETAGGIHITYRGLKAAEDYKTFCNMYW